MLVLSIDIGIKNLAHCLLDVAPTSLALPEWGVVDLTGTPARTCTWPLKKKVCGRKAVFSLTDGFCCKAHAPKPVPTAKSKEEALGLCLAHGIECDARDAAKKLSEFKKSRKTTKLNVAASECCAVAMSTELTRRYAELFDKYAVDVVLIENQIGPLAAKMKLVQGMVVQYWVQKGCKIEIVSACNKLKALKLKDTTYGQRKQLSVQHTQRLVDEHALDGRLFQTHKKKDDLADTFLQGLWYVVEKLEYERFKIT
jgi:hypothetical protein